MAKVWINEEFGTQMEKTRGDRMKWTRRFTAHAKTEFDAWLEIRKFIVQNYPVEDEQRIHTLTVTENPDGVENLWSGECTFLSPSLEQRLDEEKIPNYSFSTKGGTAHITNSLQTVNVYPGWRPKLEYFDEDGKRGFRTVKNGGKVEVEQETPPNFHGGIGWNEESRIFDGCDITVPSKRGEPISMKAREWNAVREAAVKVLNGEATPQSVAQGGRNKYVVLVKNDQPEPVPAFGVLSVTGPVHVNQDLFDQHVQFVENWIEVKSGAPTGEENEILCVVQRRSQEKIIRPFRKLNSG